MGNIQLSGAFSHRFGVIHFVGIGGIGMSGIAEILHNLGYKVQGSDLAESANVKRLQGLGIHVHIGQRAEHVENVAVVVRSSAVTDDNPEIKAARDAKIPVIARAEMLAELMRFQSCVAIAGTHGKTTTTTMVATLFEAASRTPTVINGGIINAYGTNARLGSGPWLIAEADESDGSFLRLPATIGVITNIDPEHMEHYGSFDVLKAAFRQFIDHLPFYGFAVLCMDHPEVARLSKTITDRKIITYGIEQKADVQAVSIVQDAGGSTFDVVISDHVTSSYRKLEQLRLPMPGMHNISNALASITVALEVGFNAEDIIRGFAEFQGVKRRFTHVGELGGATIIDDYGHHPKEIGVTLKTARGVLQGTKGKLIAVVQPHRYSRVKDLFDQFANCFADADHVIVTDIYAASETAIEGISKESFVQAIKDTGHKSVEALASDDQLKEAIEHIAGNGDMVVCLGAGSISKMANGLVGAGS